MKEYEKPTHAKPSLYAHYYYELMQIAKRYGYNLMIHGSLHRDLDLVAVAWTEKVKPHEKMIKIMAKRMGGKIMKIHKGNNEFNLFTKMHQGRIDYIINLNRTENWKKGKVWYDYEYYLDISVIPPK